MRSQARKRSSQRIRFVSSHRFISACPVFRLPYSQSAVCVDIQTVSLRISSLATSDCGVAEDICYKALFNHFTLIHDCHMSTDLTHNRHLVGNDHYGDSKFLVDVLQKVQVWRMWSGDPVRLWLRHKVRSVGSEARALAIATLCFCPPESCAGYAFALSASPTISRSSRAFALASAFFFP